MSVRLDIDPAKTGSLISPMLFGCNVEVTRLGMWKGLSAELVNNRKFAAAGEDDLPLRWNTAGDPGKIKIDRENGYAGNTSLVITGKDCGICQNSDVLTFPAGREYNIRLTVYSKNDIPVKMRIFCPGNGIELFEECRSAVPGEWTTFTGSFFAEKDCEKCTLEIISGGDGECRIGAVSIQSADAFFGMRREVVDIFKALHPASLRYPGGCYAEYFRWQDSILPADKRPPVGPTGLPFLLPENDDFDSVDIGLDDFMELCREVGSEPAVTVRMSEVPASDAAALVEYCNGSADTEWGSKRAANGHAEPYNIKYWFLGNELWSFGRGGLKDPAVCAQKSAEFAAAMRKVDPTIHLTGCSFYAQEHWNRPLQESAGMLLDEYSMHDYLFDNFKEMDDMEAVAKAPTSYLRPYLQRVRDSLRAGMPEGRRLSVVLDEWNMRWGTAGTAAMGLYAAGVLNLLCRESEDLCISRGYYFMAVNEGMVRVTPYTAFPDASGLMFDLFKCHHGKHLLEMPPVAAEDDLDHCISFDQEDKIVNATLINRNMSRDCIVEFAFPEKFTIRKISCRTIEPAELFCECEKFRTFETVFDEPQSKITLAPGQVVCCSVELA